MTEPVLIAVAGARWLRGCEARHKAVHLRIGRGAGPERESTPGHPGQRVAHKTHCRERQAAAHGHAPHAKTLEVCDRQPGLPARPRAEHVQRRGDSGGEPRQRGGISRTRHEDTVGSGSGVGARPPHRLGEASLGIAATQIRISPGV